MYWEDSETTTPVPLTSLSRVTMIALIAAIIGFGVYPQPILNALRPATGSAAPTASR
jgi:NADH:ubiquinone oxidoreductase subunit 4 (subunit M)